MEIKEYVRYGKIVKGIEVTKEDLLKLKKSSDYISISKADEVDNLNNLESYQIAGAIFGDIDNIIFDNKDLFDVKDAKDAKDELKLNERPDCWFVSTPEAHGYKVFKELETEFTFGEAVELCKTVGCIARKGWNGNRKDNGEFNLRMFVVYVPSSFVTIRKDTPYGNSGFAGQEMKIDAHLDLYTPGGTIQPGWLAAQPDTLATDWVVARRYNA